MNHRTLEEYKKEVFDKLDDETKLKWLYEMSKQLCEVEELKEKCSFLNEMNESNYNKYCDTLKENNKLLHILNKLEEHLELEIDDWKDVEDTLTRGMVQEDRNILNMIQKLKGSDVNV